MSAGEAGHSAASHGNVVSLWAWGPSFYLQLSLALPGFQRSRLSCWNLHRSGPTRVVVLSQSWAPWASSFFAGDSGSGDD